MANKAARAAEAAADFIPAFANEENKRLDGEIRVAKAQILELDDIIENLRDRISTMSSHYKTVQVEVQQTQDLAAAKQKEIESEKHHHLLSSRQSSRLLAEIRRLDKEIETLQDKLTTIQAKVVTNNETLESFKIEMNWNKEELEQWAIASAMKEDDRLTIEKYKRADEAKIRDLTLSIQRLNNETDKEQEKLSREIAETQAIQIELDRTAEQFQAIHLERQSVISQWESALESMQNRDASIKEAEAAFQNLQGAVNEKKQKVDLTEKTILAEQTRCEKTQLEITAAERLLGKLRQVLSDAKIAVVDFKDELELLRNQVAASTSKGNVVKNEITMSNDSIKEKKQILERLQKRYHTKLKDLEDARLSAKTKETLAKDAEVLHREMEQRTQELERSLKKVKEDLFKQTTALQALKSEDITVQGEISSAQASLKTLQARIYKLDHERQRQQELLYAVDFQSQLMQRKVARVSGERTMEERDELNREIAQLDSSHDEQESLLQIIRVQVKRVEAELGKAHREMTDLKREDERLRDKLDEVRLESQSLQKTIKVTQKARDDLLVNHDTLKLEVTQVRESLTEQLEETFELENRKAQLKITAEENAKEIGQHIDVIKAKLSGLEDERSKLLKELSERRSKVQILKSKHESVTAKTRKEGEEQSQAYFIIKAAQEHEELRRQGDELDAQIKSTEKEVIALQSAHSQLQQQNHQYKGSLSNSDASVVEGKQEKQRLEEKLKSLAAAANRKRKELEEIDGVVLQSEEDLQGLEAKKASMNASIQNVMTSGSTLERELKEQEDKIERALRVMNQKKSSLLRSGKLVKKDPSATPIELDAKIIAAREQNRNLLHALSVCLETNPDVLCQLASAAKSQGILLPSRPASSSSSSSNLSSRVGGGRGRR